MQSYLYVTVQSLLLVSVKKLLSAVVIIGPNTGAFSIAEGWRSPDGTVDWHRTWLHCLMCGKDCFSSGNKGSFLRKQQGERNTNLSVCCSSFLLHPLLFHCLPSFPPKDHCFVAKNLFVQFTAHLVFRIPFISLPSLCRVRTAVEAAKLFLGLS